MKANLFINMQWSTRLLQKITVVVGNFLGLVLGSANPPSNYKV